MPTPVLATYRLQLCGGTFTLADAEKLVDYLADLGITHLYLSPILTAAPGSEHGYDVTDPTSVSADLGGADGLAGLAETARRHGLGLIVDIVPNHSGVALPQHNPWWNDILRHGRESRYATYFDIDWSADTEGRVLLPVLGSDSDIDELEIDGGTLRYYDMHFPIAPGTASDGACAAQVHDRQHYRLTGWRGVCGYRRFFSVTSLAGLRQEDVEVFRATHAEVGRWFAEGLVDGLRVDHPDGLADPAGYLVRLRELTGPQAWIVIEKILAPGEPLDPALPVDGSTGYDALREIGGVFIDPTGADTLTALAEAGEIRSEAQEPLRRLMIRTTTDMLASELGRACRAVESATGTSHPDLPAAIAELLSRVGVYRSDYPVLSGVLGEAMASTVADKPDMAAPLEILAAALTHPEAAARLQQLCGAMTAKAVEDCHFYRDTRLVALNEVGGEPQRFGVSAAEFHRANMIRARLWPHTMTTLSTHDTKRGEDVRARIGVLSQVPGLWAEFVGRWEAAHPSPDLPTGLFLWQNIFGVWPANGRITTGLRERLHTYAEKAIREAGRRTSWQSQDPEFEEQVHSWLDAVLDGAAAAEMTALVARLEPHAHNDALGQKLLALTVPGVPDVYQGTELWEDSLVDPDNRRPVDYAERRAALHRLEHPKMQVVRAALHARRDRPAAFLDGDYQPVPASGPAAEHMLAFRRGDDVLVAVSRWTVRLSEHGWQTTGISLPAGSWRDRITGAEHRGTVPAEILFSDLPAALLERTDG